MKIQKTSILLLIILLGITAAFGETPYQTCGGFSSMMTGYYGSGFIFLSWITYLLFLGLIIAAIYWLIKSANKKR